MAIDNSDNNLMVVAAKRKTGKEKLTYKSKNLKKSLLDFWQWSASDLMANTLRGTLAEFIIAVALGIDTTTQEAWKPYDFDYKGLKIEVKSSAYIQTWAQKALSKIQFNVPQTHAYNSCTGLYAEQLKRQADIYVFCILSHREQNSVNPLILDQWQFLIVNTKTFNEALGVKKIISLSKLLSIEHTDCKFDTIKTNIDKFISK